jgi:protein-S-isoprenylcysteine O-methyltransferase Ste14
MIGETHKISLTNKIHATLAHSYSSYFLFLLLGIALDIIFPFRLFREPAVMALGLVFLVLASGLILWAQHTTRNLHEGQSLAKEAFCRGPYCYTRTPTHWGLFLLTLGLGIVLNAFFVVLTTTLSFLLSRTVFLKRYEQALVEKYGSPYLEYQKDVRL